MARDNYQLITDHITAALEELAAGTRTIAPWQRPWNASAAAAHNGHTGHVYRGINLLLIWCSGYADPRWYTFKQVSDNYGASHVRKGEKGTTVTFFQVVSVKDDDETTDGKRARRRPLLRTYTVFNHAQIEWEAGREPAAPELKALDPAAAHAEAMAALVATGASVEHGGERACYSPSLDAIRMPPVGAFRDEAAYISTRAHETVHWTGHTTRCARDLSGRFGSESYAAEELVAEIGAAFFCADFGLPSQLDENHLPYLASWIKVLRGDKFAIFTAARLAREAVGYIRGERAAADDVADVA